MYTDDRNAYRKMFFDVWQKHLKGLPLQPVESEVRDVIVQHPEYHAMLDQPDTFMTQEFALEENPFFHMSLHIAVREQLRLDRPAGVRSAYETLKTQFDSALDAEHYMTTMLAQTLHQSQLTGTPADESEYLKKLKK